ILWQPNADKMSLHTLRRCIWLKVLFEDLLVIGIHLLTRKPLACASNALCELCQIGLHCIQVKRQSFYMSNYID
ncbi:hypothetical protein ACJX0J_019697, partial [Zea mays]